MSLKCGEHDDSMLCCNENLGRYSPSYLWCSWVSFICVLIVGTCLVIYGLVKRLKSLNGYVTMIPFSDSIIFTQCDGCNTNCSYILCENNLNVDIYSCLTASYDSTSGCDSPPAMSVAAWISILVILILLSGIIGLFITGSNCPKPIIQNQISSITLVTSISQDPNSNSSRSQ